VGNYSAYRNLESQRVYKRGGMLYLGPESAGIPLIPEDPSCRALRFSTLREGLRSPLEFRKLEDGSLILILERNIFHKTT
jgi:Pab87 octamerisation domain